MKADAIVVGAGPAGAATAILLAETGRAVVVLDRAERPRPKICGEYLSPEAARILDRLGVLKAVQAGGARAIRGMRITAPDGTTLTGTYESVGGHHPYAGALAVLRPTLDGALAERLRVLPVDFREGVRVTDVLVEGDRVVGVEAIGRDGCLGAIRAPVVVAADGRASVIAGRLGLRRPHRLRRMALVTYASGLAGGGDLGEIFVDPPDYAILNPVAPERVNLSLVVPLAHVAPWSDRLPQFFAARVRQLPHLARRLAGAELVAPIRAMGPLAYRVDPPRHGGVLLVGDAAGFYDPFTGEGIFAALRSAELAVETVTRALSAGDVSVTSLAAFERARRDAFGGKARVTRALQAVIRRRWLANVTARVLARRPSLLQGLMGVIGDYVPPGELLGALRAR